MSESKSYTYYTTVPEGEPLPTDWEEYFLWEDKDEAVMNAEGAGHQLVELTMTVTSAKFIPIKEE